MTLTVRRVVTGHDENGRAIVSIDEISKNSVQTRPGAHAAVIWTTEGFPVDNDGNADASGRKVGTTLDNGTVFRDETAQFHQAALGGGVAVARAAFSPTMSWPRLLLGKLLTHEMMRRSLSPRCPRGPSNCTDL